MSQLHSTSSGELFTIGYGDCYRDVVPTTPLDPNHAFCGFWRSFLAKLSDGCDPFWDAIMSIYKGHPSFAGNRSEMERFKVMFLRNPPNVAITDLQSLNVFGCHKPTPRLRGFIFLSDFFVNKWAAARDDATAIRYDALLKATIVHEVAHWAQTLRDDHLSPNEVMKLKKQMTPERFRTLLSSQDGEAGYYAEVAIFGGVLTVYLLGQELRNVGLCRLVPPGTLPSVLFPSPSSIGNQHRMLCDSDDANEERPRHCPGVF